MAASALPIFLTGSLAPELRREFEFDDVVLGVAVGTSFATATIASAPAGRLVARIGAGAAVRLTAGLAIGCSLGIALLARSAATLIALLVIGGLSNALSSPAASAVLTRDIALDRQGIGYGALTAGAPIGSVLAGLALPLVAEPTHWRLAFVAAGGLALLAAITSGGRGDGIRIHGDGVPSAVRARATVSWPGVAKRWDRVHALAGTAALASVASTGLISFLVVFSVDSGMNASDAGVLLAVTGMAAAVSRIGLGMVADRHADRAPHFLLALLAISFLGFFLLLTESPALIVVGALMAGGLGWGWSGLLTLIAVREAEYDPAEAVGIVMSGLFLGSITGPIAVGVIASSAGFSIAWLLAACTVLMAAGTVVGAQSTWRLDAKGPPD